MRRILAALVAAFVLAGLVVAAVGVTSKKAVATPISTNEATYLINGRIFPDPQGCTNGAPGTSPFAKGNVCAADFIQHDEMRRGLMFLEQTFPSMTRFYQLSKDFRCNGEAAATEDEGCKRFLSAGLPVSDDTTTPDAPIERDRRRLHMVRITDETAPMPLKKRKWYIFPLSIHGIERAGVEGGLRAAEDLATWGACENLPADQIETYVDCEAEVTGNEQKPYPLLEATPNESISAGDALKKSVVVFVMPNPDGWLRGDRMRDHGEPSSSFYQRYNGNGVDINRDWPTLGWTFRPYTPASEPESKAFGRVLRDLGPTPNGDPRWEGGIDLHGQLIDRAFSFTLLGAGQFDFGENQAILQTVEGAWRDAENRLGWSTIIKPNEAPEDDPRVYGVQWGTVWDTIDYTITGGFGDWIGSPLGLGAKVPIDNEMSLSHLSTCGVGTCYVPEFEQLHVDGNKSLVYAMVNYGLKPENKNFRTKGRVAYVRNRGVVKERTDRNAAPPRFTKLPPQEDIEGEMLLETNDYTFQFPVLGPKDGHYNGGLEAQLTCVTSDVNPNCELTDAVLERKVKKGEERPPECGPPPEECWEVINTYFLQGVGYSATGKALHGNLPQKGQWRVRLEGQESQVTGGFELDINFTREKAWSDPGQIGFKATSMKFWRDLERFAEPSLSPLTIGEIKNTNAWKRRYDTIAVTNRVYKEVAGDLKNWVAQFNGNLVLTDKAVKMLDTMNIVKGGVDSVNTYAGYINFETNAAGEDENGSYDDPSGLAKNVNKPGSAEGGQEENDAIEGEENHRHQIYEPVPIGIAIEDASGSDQFNSPVWYVEENSLNGAKGNPNAVGSTASLDNISLGEIKYRGGRIRWAGALLPNPSKKFDNPFGVANYAITYSGYQVLQNMLTYNR